MASITEPTLDHISDLLGADANDLLGSSLRDDRSLASASARARTSSSGCCSTPIAARDDSQPAALFDHGRLAGTGLCQHPAGRPGHRAQRRAPASLQTRRISIRERSSSSRSRAAATPWPRRSASSGVSRRYAHRIPFIVKLNHNELLTYPNTLRPGSVRKRQARLGDGRGRRRRDDLLRQRGEHPPDAEVSEAFEQPTNSACSPSCGATCATPPSRHDKDYHAVRRPHRPGQPSRRDDRGRHHQAEAARRTTTATARMNRTARATARPPSSSTAELTTDHPIDLCRYQVANCYMGRAGLINSGGASSARSDLAEAVAPR